MKTKTNHFTFTRLTSGARQRASIFIAALFCSMMLSAIAMAQNVTVNPGAGSYPTLKAAFDAINAGTHTGAVTVSIDADTSETVSAVLNASGVGAASYTSIVITPNGARTISGTGLAGTPLIDLNGADNVTIDGLNSSPNSLFISSDSTNAAASTIRFIADATNNTVQNCTIQGSETGVTSGTIFFSTGTASGNDGNVINSNNITSAGANLPANAIFSLGTSAAIDNSGISITGNNIFDYFSATLASVGVNLGATGNSAWTISNNKLFQSANRTFTAANTHAGINIGVGSGYTVSGNTIGFSNAGGTGTTNLLGITTAGTFAGTFPSSYTLGTATLNATRYIAINAAFTAGGAASSIQGNTIAGFALLTSSGASTANGVWCGINVTSGNANIGTTTGNTIGATSGQASIYTAATTTGGTAVGIFATSVNTVNIQNNTMGAIDAVGTSATLSGGFTGIDSAGTAGVFTINSNILGNTTADNIRTGYTTTTGVSGGPLTNSGGILTSTTGATAAQVGIRNTATGTTLSINSNTLRGWAVGGTVTAVTGVSNTGANTTSVTNNNNLLGTGGLGWVRYAFANSGALTGITRTSQAAAATMAINSNDFQGIVHSVQGTSAHTYINWSHASSVTDTINNNTFTNLNVNTTGSVTFLARASNMTATGVENCNSNSIVTGFTKGGSTGTVTLFSANSSSVTGSAMNQSSNNFSNINIVGTTTIAGWSNTEGASSSSGPTKTIANNTFNNWTATATPSGSITGMSVNFSGSGTTVNGNTFSNFTGGSTITALSLGSSNSAAGTTAASGNLIDPITSSGASAVIAITSASTGTTTISKNKIYDIGGTNAGTTVNGIAITGGLTTNVFNNLIGNLTASAATVTSPASAIIGINLTSTAVTSTLNVSFNTVYINATSSGANFATTGVFHTSSTTSTTATLNLRDNIIVNTSTAAGTGLTVAYRRSAGAASNLANYGSASNNNDFYAGTPSATNLIYADGTSSAQTISAYKSGVFTAGTIAPRDSNSISENPPFLSTTGSSANFLHINTATPTQLESGGIPVVGISDDFDGDTRNASTPDIGADEFAGIALDLSPPTISYTPLGNTNSTANRTLTATITDPSGVAAGGLAPRIYFKKSTDGSYVSTQCSGSSPTYTCTIDNSLVGGGSVAINDIIQYFVVAQDTAGNVGANPSAGFTATDVNTVTSAPTSPNSYTIVGSISGNFNVGVGQTYPTITDAVNDLNNKVVTGAVTFLLTDNSYTSGAQQRPSVPDVFPLTINANSGSSATNTITIKPAPGVIAAITASVASGPLLTVKASYCTIDGSNSGGTDRSLTITNSSTTAPNVIVFGSVGTTPITDDTLKNCVIINGINTSSAVVVSDTTTVGNAGFFNNITIRNNNVQKAFRGILAVATVSGTNGSGTLITQNDLNTAGANSIRLNPIAVQGINGVTITNNNMGNISDANAEIPVGILLATGVDNAVVTGNTISSIVTTSTSTSASAEGILISAGAATTSINVSNNTISTLTSSGTAAGNFYALGSFSPNCTISNNNISGLTNSAASVTMWGIALAGASNSTVSGNSVTSVSSTNTGSGGTPFGINLQGAITNCNVTGNTVSNITTLGSSTTPTGILLSGTLDGITVQKNNINGVINNNAGTWGAWGMRLNGGNNHVVKNNFVSNVTQNMTGGGAFSTSFGIFGIQIDTGTGHKVYNNSVNLFGLMPGTAASSLLTAAFSVVSTTSTGMDVRNNIFANNITGGTTSIAHVSIYLPSGGTSAMNLTDNKNSYYFGTDAARQGTGQAGTTAGTNFFTTLAALKAYSSTLSAGGTNDNASIASTAAVPYTTTTNLHLGPAAPEVDTGVTIASVTDDFDGDTRPQIAAYDIGADEVPNSAPTISAAAGVTRQQGSAASNSTIATVNDVNTGANSVTVTVTSANPSNGVTISNIVNTNGTVAADIVASCNATNATFTLQASDGSLTSTDTLSVTVTPDTAPTLTYNNDSVAFGGSTTINPATGPSDNGSVSTIAVQSTGTYTGTISVDNVTGIVSISSAAPTGTHTITIRATDNCGLTTDATFTLTVPNTAPSIAAAAGVTRQQGSPASNSTIATVNDTESGAGGVGVTVTSANPSNGVTISNIVNTGGTVTADVIASCSATNASFTLQASDGSLTATDTLNVTVTADATPTLTYNNDSVAYNGSTTINPATGPSDNGSVSTIVVQSQGTYTGTISVDNVTGIVSISNAKPAGTHTITIRATDNCGLTTDATFTLTVGAASSNADLSSLVLSDGTLTPAFTSANTSYTASVPNSTSSMTVTPTAADANATIQVQVNGGGYTTVPSGSPSGSLALNVGANTIDVKVAAQDETRPGGIHTPATIKIYTITVTRAAAASNNADLSDLTATAGPLSPAFDANTLSYTVNTPFTTTSTTVTPTAADAGATITVNGNPVASGSPSASIPLSVGNNLITIVVTAADTTTTKTYTINVIRGAQVVVSGSTGADGSYATLQAAFAALNANGTQAGNTISVSITGDTTETAAAVLNQPTVSSWTSLTVTPSGARTVSGALATPLIDLAGADNVTINGLNASGNSLVLSNTSTAATAGTSTIRFINGATNNTVQNCTIAGSSTASTTTAGGNVLFSTSTVAGGNSTNTITNNNIGPAGANLPTKCVMGLGTTANPNAGNIISNNNVFDFFAAATSVAGVDLQGNNSTGTISNNRIYQTATRTFTGAAGITYSGILVNNTGTFTVSGNVIGFGAANGTGTTTITGTGTGLGNQFRGISFTSSNTTTFSTISGNTVSGINQTTNRTSTTTDNSAFIGIQSGSSAADAPANMTGNTIGSLDGSSTIVINDGAVGSTAPIDGILDFDFQDALTIANNNIGSITIQQAAGVGSTAGFRGIIAAGTTATTHAVTNNIIGGTAAGSITNSLVGSNSVYGIQGAATNINATGNLVRNLVSNSNGAGLIVTCGIITGSSSTGVNTTSQNVVHSLSNNSAAASNVVRGIQCTFPATANVIERNFVHSLSITSTAVTTVSVDGIVHGSTGSGTYKNNMVRLGVDASGASITTGIGFNGILEQAGTNSFSFNSVYIGGSGVASAANTFAFNSAVVTNVRSYKDNIFWNARSNASGGGKNYAISVGGTTPNPAGLTSNFNDLFANGTGGFVGLFNATDQLTLANWQAATGQDANSISANPQFVNPTGTAATVNLHITCESPADGSGTPVAGITNDFDNETRNATNPDIGADEINLTPPTPVSAVSSKMHGAFGPFDINLPLAGPAGIESRSGGPTGAYQVIVTFGSNVTVSGAVVASGTGVVGSVTGSGTTTITVNLTGVTNAQYLTIKLLCVDDTVNVGSVSVKMGVLVADVTAEGNVNATDVSQVRLDVGNAVDGTNFRSDVNANGTINSSDVSIARLQSGTALPP